jgi:hypothetical protein
VIPGLSVLGRPWLPEDRDLREVARRDPDLFFEP